jgi:hypothetical protein
MSFDVSGVHAARAARAALQRPNGAPAVARANGGFAGAMSARGAVQVDAIPASPPPDVIHEMLAAQRAVEDMHRRGRELHFEMASGRLRIELRDLDGNVLKQIPASTALEIASGRRVV